MASGGPLHTVDNECEGLGHGGGPVPQPGAGTPRSLPPASKKPSQAHTWQSLVSSCRAFCLGVIVCFARGYIARAGGVFQLLCRAQLTLKICKSELDCYACSCWLMGTSCTAGTMC